MKEIQGLIVKDLLQLKSYKRTIIIYICIFILIGLVQGESGNMISMMITMLTLGFGMFSMATFSYDEMAKADIYIRTLPVTKKDIVKSKYALVILSTIIGAILGTILLGGILLFSKESNGFDMSLSEVLALAIGSIFGISIVESIQIPCFFKWGAEKGRFQMFILVIVIAFSLGGIIYILEKMGIYLNVDNFLPLILVIITAVMYTLSYKISDKIYSKKEI